MTVKRFTFIAFAVCLFAGCGTSGPIVSHFGTETVAVDLVVRTYEINDYRKTGPTKHESYASVFKTA